MIQLFFDLCSDQMIIVTLPISTAYRQLRLGSVVACDADKLSLVDRARAAVMSRGPCSTPVRSESYFAETLTLTRAVLVSDATYRGSVTHGVVPC